MGRRDAASFSAPLFFASCTFSDSAFLYMFGRFSVEIFCHTHVSWGGGGGGGGGPEWWRGRLTGWF